ncbi:hypothetical protein IW262DRAFT_1553166 [Armillaria fumosa]|nr:hypothetical protein IW262DRAFT_1553166 [Armillaria fumosa]
MTSHRAILSIHDAFRDASLKTEAGVNVPGLPELASGLNMKKEIGENGTVTLDDVEEANYVALAIRVHFASSDPETKRKVELITEMYHLAVKNAYSNTTFFRDCATPVDYEIKIRELEGKIAELKSDIASSRASSADLDMKITTAQATANNAQTVASNAQTTANTAENIANNAENTANNAQTTANTAQATANTAKTNANNANNAAHNAQTTANAAKITANIARITAKNVLIADRNSHRRYTEEFSALRKVTSDSGLNLAKEVCPATVNETDLKDISPAPTVGATPKFDGRIAKYSDEDILKMIIFYNDKFGIALNDNLPERIDKFRSFLSDCGEL